MGKIANTLLKVQNFLGVILFVGLTIVVTLQIFTRFVLHTPFIWSEEVARFLFFWVALTGASVSVRLRRHFVIDVLQMTASERGSGKRAKLDKILWIISDILILGYAIFLLKLGWEYTEFGVFRTGTNSQINMSIVYAAIPFAAGTMIIHAIANLIDTLRAFRRDTPSSHHADGGY